MPLIDLHLHSFYSDGEDGPDELLRLAIKRKLSVFSVTDHNFIMSKNHRFSKKIEQSGIKFIQGIEISSFDDETKSSFHILGYSKNFDTHEINTCLKKTVEGYNNRAKKIIKKLNKKYPGLDLNFDDLKKKNPEIYVSRNTIAIELKRFLKSDATVKELSKEAFVDEKSNWMLSPKETIHLIIRLNGIPVLAHSGRLFSKDKKVFTTLLKNFKEYGLRGVEVYSPKHSKKEIYGLLDLSRRLKLLATAGSDWHGPNRSYCKTPGLKCSKRELTKILDTFV